MWSTLDGRKITRNITHIVHRAKYAEMKLDEDLSNRTWFIEPIKTGKVFVSDFYTSRFTGALCITVSVPVFTTTTKSRASWAWISASRPWPRWSRTGRFKGQFWVAQCKGRSGWAPFVFRRTGRIVRRRYRVVFKKNE
jgi:hypothetical protein